MNESRLITIFSIILFIIISAAKSYGLDLYEFSDHPYAITQKTISLDFNRAPLNDVLKIFSKQSGLNFIASADIANKTVNLYLEKVPVEEALERILTANNLTYELDYKSNIFVVKEAVVSEKKRMTRVYPLKHATLPSSKINSTLSAFETSSEESSESVAGGLGILSAVQAVLSADGAVTQDTRTNSLVVTDIPTQFAIVEETIARLDVRVPQILIEVEILDIAKTTADLLGPKFGSDLVVYKAAEDARQNLTPLDLKDLIDDTSTLDLSGLTFTLQFLRTQTDTKNLARPRILTLNNETAEIRVTTDEAIGEVQSESSVEGLGSSTTEAERVETGVFLTVTPQANIQTGEILLAIEPRVIDATQSTGFEGAEKFKDPEERGTRSLIRVHDGDTVMMGGLLRSEVNDIRTRVPILGRIPGLGAAFRHKDKAENQRELVIFLSPHILKDQVASSPTPKYTQNFSREQDIPSYKLNQINKDLSNFEKNRF